MASGTNGYRCGCHTECCYKAWVAGVMQRVGCSNWSCNFKLVQQPNGYRLAPNWCGAMGLWGPAPINGWGVTAKMQWSVAPMGIGWSTMVCAAMGLWGLHNPVAGVPLSNYQITMVHGPNGYRCGCHWVCGYGQWGCITQFLWV